MTDELLIPLEKYLSAGVHIGTKFKTKSMEPYIYKVNPNGLSILNVQKIDEKLRIGAKLLGKYSPEEILVVIRRENVWKAANAFSKITGIKTFVGRYPAGVLTNPYLETFMEPKLMLIGDPWPDKNAINDAMKVGTPIIGLCDSNNTTNKLDYIIPCNNKGSKSLGLIFYVLAQQYLKQRGIKGEPNFDDFQE
jgi:small subunit ribosomal protein S2